MIKYTIPTILSVTVLVTAIFAFMPVQEASTIHTTIDATQLTLQFVQKRTTDADIDPGEEITLDCDQPFEVMGFSLDEGTGIEASEAINIDLVEIEDGANDRPIASDTAFAATLYDAGDLDAGTNGPTGEINMLGDILARNPMLAGAFVSDDGKPMDFQIAEVGTIDAGDTIDIFFVVLTETGAACTAAITAGD